MDGPDFTDDTLSSLSSPSHTPPLLCIHHRFNIGRVHVPRGGLRGGRGGKNKFLPNFTADESRYISEKIRDEGRGEGLAGGRNFRYSSRTAAIVGGWGRATGNHPRLYRNRIYIRPRLSVRRPQRTPQRGTVVNNEYASVFVYSGSTQRVSLPLSPPPPLPIHRPTTATLFGHHGGGRGELQHQARSSLLFTTPQLANPKASILRT